MKTVDVCDIRTLSLILPCTTFANYTRVCAILFRYDETQPDDTNSPTKFYNTVSIHDDLTSQKVLLKTIIQYLSF